MSKSKKDKVINGPTKAPAEPTVSTQSLQVLHQCAAQVPANNGQQAALLANALLEVEAVLHFRDPQVPPPGAAAKQPEDK